MRSENTVGVSSVIDGPPAALLISTYRIEGLLSGSSERLLFTTSDCTGQAYVQTADPLPGFDPQTVPAMSAGALAALALLLALFGALLARRRSGAQ